MAVFGVVADIHGNLEALRAALARLDERGAERIVCLGDIVGYNADSNAVVALLRQRDVECIAGNHDLIGIGRLSTRRCSDAAAYALARTRRALAPETAAFLAALPPHRRYGDRFVLVHGGVDDVEEYVRSTAAVRDNAERFAGRFPGVPVCFFGHTHKQGVFEVRHGSATELVYRPRHTLAPDATWFVNPGSVDAARKRDPRDKVAECALYDDEARTLEFHRVAYDHAGAEAKAAAAGYRMGPSQARWTRLQRRVGRAVRRYISIPMPAPFWSKIRLPLPRKEQP
jgi:predicted phosphodiesterase